jgi:hypothetical protein
LIGLVSASPAFADPVQHVVTDLDPGAVYDVLVDGVLVRSSLQPDEWNVLTFETSSEGAVQVVRVGEGDAVAPGALSNELLVAVEGTDATLSWRAPGDDGLSGSVHHYEARASADSVDALQWSLATRLLNVDADAPAGSTETGVVHGLAPRTTNFVVLRALDDAGNRGPVSRPVRVLAGNGSSEESEEEEDDTFAAPPRPAAAFGAGGVFLTWARSTGVDVVGYHVYRRTESESFVRLTPEDSPLETTEYLDAGVVDGQGYYYRITGVDASGTNETAPSAEVWIRASASVPSALVIERVFPSPVRERAVFRFAVPEFGPGGAGGERVTIDLFDAAGHRITRVVDEVLQPGTHEVTWRIPDGQNVPPGVYLGVLRLGAKRAQQEIAIAR